MSALANRGRPRAGPLSLVRVRQLPAQRVMCHLVLVPVVLQMAAVSCCLRAAHLVQAQLAALWQYLRALAVLGVTCPWVAAVLRSCERARDLVVELSLFRRLAAARKLWVVARHFSRA